MPIDPDVAVGAEVGTVEFSWTSSDVLLYHLGVGAQDLSYTLETAGLQVLPSFAVVAPTFHATQAPSLDLPGCDINLSQVVHGSQAVEVTGPLPTEGAASLTTRITDVWDKGKAAVVWQEGVATDPAGAELWRVRSSIYVKGEGGWGGDRGESTAVAVPDRSPDATTTYTVTPQQALLYRLCGDRNPLHADPEFAKAAGFEAPILHGLCTYAIVLREVIDLLLDGDATTVGGFTARFAGVVVPGETSALSGWDEPDGIVVTATVGDDARPALSDCLVTKALSTPRLGRMERQPADSPYARTVESYEQIADDYARETAGAGVLSNGLTRLAETVPAGHALEIGSGPGWDADALEEAGMTVRRTDITQAFIDFQRARGKEADRLDVINDDLGGPYDAVVSLHVLQHVEPDDLPAVLAKVAGALRPGGRFLVSIPLGEGVGWEVGESGRIYYQVLRTEAEFVAALAQAGLRSEWTERAVHGEETGWLCVLSQWRVDQVSTS